MVDWNPIGWSAASIRALFVIVSKYMRILWLAFLPLVVLGQNPSTKPTFDIADVNKTCASAHGLVAYDTVAWKTSDLVMA